MSRGKSSFSTMDSINTELASDYHKPDYSNKSEVILDLDAAANKNIGPETKKAGKLVDLDPVTKINKGFEDCVTKTSTLNIRSEGRNYDSADRDWKTHENKIKAERQAKLVPELKKNYGVANQRSKAEAAAGKMARNELDNLHKDLSLEKGEHALTKRDAHKAAVAYGQESQRNFDLSKKLSNAERKLTRGKLAAATAVPLVGSAIYGAYKYGKKNGVATKGLVSEGIKKLVTTPGKLKEAAKTAAATGTLGYGMLKTTPGETLGVIDTKAFKVEQLKTPAMALGAGVVGGDIANRLQDSRAKKTREGMVTEIVERLKKE